MDLKMTPYQNLKFPFDIICIEIIVIGFSAMTSFLIKTINNKTSTNITAVTLPILIILKYGIDRLLSTETGTETHDLFLTIFRLTYPISIVVLIVQMVSFKMTSRILVIVSSVIGVFWTLISTVELTRFLDNRQGAAEYAAEPKNIWSFVLIMFMITSWTILKLNDLKRQKINYSW